MTDRIFAEAGGWALACDGVQWILMRRRSQKNGGWKRIWFVRSHRDVLALGMREKGTDEDTARLLLAGLRDTFDEWKAAQSAPTGNPVLDIRPELRAGCIAGRG